MPGLDRAVAIVGTRAADVEALELAHDLAADLCAAGCVVISGGARGIDAAAHEGALSTGGRTVAVLASGFVPAYPPEHARLFARIEASGALVSEHPDGTPPRAGLFLQRNRLVAALGRAVVVVQAPARSGALSTASWARSLGRPVLVVPAAPWDPRGVGCLSLLRSGASVCAGARDVLSVCAFPARPCGANADDQVAVMHEELDADGRRILRALGARARHVDELVRATGWEVARIQRALLCLLLSGCVEERAGARWAPIRRRT